MGLLRRTRNGKENLEITPEDVTNSSNTPKSSVSSSEQIPLDQRHDRVIIVPQVPTEIAELLAAIGAEPISSAFKAGDADRHYRVFVLPESMRMSSGRYSRIDEFSDGTNPIHGWYPGTVYAPDNTLLFSMNDLKGLNVVIGKTWIRVSTLLGEQQGPVSLPEEVIFPNGVHPEFAHGENLEKFVNGIEQEGMFHIAHKAKSAFAKVIGHHVDSDEFDEAFKKHVDSIREPMRDLDERRGSLFENFLKSIETRTREVSPTVVLPDR